MNTTEPIIYLHYVHWTIKVLTMPMFWLLYYRPAHKRWPVINGYKLPYARLKSPTLMGSPLICLLLKLSLILLSFQIDKSGLVTGSITSVPHKFEIVSDFIDIYSYQLD